MTLFVLDTDIRLLFQEGQEAVCRRVCTHALDELATTVITVEEQLSGWYTLLRRAKGSERLARAYQRLADSVTFLSHFQILSFTEEAIRRYEYLTKPETGNEDDGPADRGHRLGAGRYACHAKHTRFPGHPRPDD